MRPRAAPPICYRVHRGRCSVYAVGPRSRDPLLALACYLRSVQTAAGEVLAVREVAPHVGTCDVEIASAASAVYEFRTPYYPGRAAYRRRPSPSDYTEIAWPGQATPHHAARVAWAGTAILSSVATWLREVCGLVPSPTRYLSVQVLEYRERSRLEWARPDRELRDVRAGCVGVFAVNAILPPGVGIGARCSEGFGEVWPCP